MNIFDEDSVAGLPKRKRLASANMITQFNIRAYALFGEQYRQIAISCSSHSAFAIDCLDSEDSKVRSIAMLSFAMIWEMNNTALEKMFELAKLPEMRRIALAAISGNTDSKTAKLILQQLLRMIDCEDDNSEKIELYHALCIQAVLINLFCGSFSETLENYISYISGKHYVLSIDTMFISRLRSMLRASKGEC